MGIVLEFGENTTASARTSPSPSISPSQSNSSQPNLPHDHVSVSSDNGVVPSTGIFPQSKHTNAATLASLSVRRHSHADVPDGDEAQREEEQLRKQPQGQAPDIAVPPLIIGALEDSNQDGRIPIEEEQNPAKASQINARSVKNEPSGASLRAALLSVVDRWRGVAGAASRRMPIRPDRPDHNYTATVGRGGRISHTLDKKMSPDEDVQMLPGPVHTLTEIQPGGRGAPGPLPDEEPKRQNSPAPSPTELQGHRARVPPAEDSFEMATLGGLLWQRAARAREIYLASKYLNRWADRTATKLEREAVARRHMIRFRCFRGWSNAPSVKIPAIDCLRATTAVQKLRRAIAYQEQQLDLAASAIAHSHQVKLAQRTMEQWACHAMQEHLRSRIARRATLAALGRWKSQALEDRASWRAAKSLGARCVELTAARKWADQAQEGRSLSAVAEDVGTTCHSLAYVAHWQSQVAVKRRGEAYRQMLRLKRAVSAFEQWSLSARVQAYRWRCEYQSSEKIFSHWLKRVQQDRKTADAARLHDQREKLAKMSKVLEQFSGECSQLAHLHGRALLYIRSTRLLNAFDGAAERRMSRMKSAVRRYLMMRSRGWSRRSAA